MGSGSEELIVSQHNTPFSLFWFFHSYPYFQKYPVLSPPGVLRVFLFVCLFQRCCSVHSIGCPAWQLQSYHSSFLDLPRPFLSISASTFCTCAAVVSLDLVLLGSIFKTTNHFSLVLLSFAVEQDCLHSNCFLNTVCLFVLLHISSASVGIRNKRVTLNSLRTVFLLKLPSWQVLWKTTCFRVF